MTQRAIVKVCTFILRMVVRVCTVLTMMNNTTAAVIDSANLSAVDLAATVLAREVERMSRTTTARAYSAAQQRVVVARARFVAACRQYGGV